MRIGQDIYLVAMFHSLACCQQKALIVGIVLASYSEDVRVSIKWVELLASSNRFQLLYEISPLQDFQSGKLFRYAVFHIVSINMLFSFAHYALS